MSDDLHVLYADDEEDIVSVATLALEMVGGLKVTSYNSGAAFNPAGEKVAEFKGGSDQLHYDNFVKAVRSRNHADLNADIEEGHLSSALCHLGNISLRLGQRSSIADAKAMTVSQDGVITRAGYNFTGSDGLSATFYSLILQNGGQYLNEDGTFSVNTPEGTAALELMKRIVDEGIIDPVLFNDESNWVGDSFFDGSSAMGLVGPWAVPEYSGDYPDVAAVTQYVPLPTVSGTQALVAASGWGLTVSQNSTAQDVAWDFIRFAALDPANAVQWNLQTGTLPALRANGEGAAAEQLVAEFPYFGPFLQVLPFAQYEGNFHDRDLVWYEITYPRILTFLQGNATLEETLETIDREVNETMQ